MMKTNVRFFRAMFSLPMPWPVFIALLMAVNMVGPLFFLDTLEGKVVLGSIMLGATVMTELFRRKGFVRLLGIGHLPWVAMVPWLWIRLGEAPPGSAFAVWLTSVIVLNSISLAIDFVDVARYLRGERELSWR